MDSRIKIYLKNREQRTAWNPFFVPPLCFAFLGHFVVQKREKRSRRSENHYRPHSDFTGIKPLWIHQVTTRKHMFPVSMTAAQCSLTCFFTNSCEVSADVSVSAVGQLRHLLSGGAARDQTQLLLQDVCTLCSTGDANLMSGGQNYYIIEQKV